MFKSRLILVNILLSLSVLILATDNVIAKEKDSLKPDYTKKYISSNINDGDFLSNNFLTRLSKSTYKLTTSIGHNHKNHIHENFDDEYVAADYFMNIYSSIFGFVGDLFNDASTLVTGLLIDDDYFVKSTNIYQCTAPLPTAILSSMLGPFTQLKHTWLLIDGKTYVMPYTEKKTYFGGRAFITTPDMFIFEEKINPATANCTPIFIPKQMEESTFNQRFKCIANKLSKNLGEYEKMIPVYDYHVLLNNCSSAVRYITECASGEISQNPNLAVGSHIEHSDKALIRYNSRIYTSAQGHNIKSSLQYITKVATKAWKEKTDFLPADFTQRWHNLKQYLNEFHFSKLPEGLIGQELSQIKDLIQSIDNLLLQDSINYSLISSNLEVIKKIDQYAIEVESDYGSICERAVNQCDQERSATSSPSVI